MAHTLPRSCRKHTATPPLAQTKAAIVHAVHDQSGGRSASPSLTDRRRLRRRSPLRMAEVSSESPYPKYTPMLVLSSTRDSNDSLPGSRVGSEESRPLSRPRPRQLRHNYDIRRDAQYSGVLKPSHSFRIHGIPSYMRRVGAIKRIHGRTVSQQGEFRPSFQELYSKMTLGTGKLTAGRTQKLRVERKMLKSEVFFQPPKVTVKRRADSCARHFPPVWRDEGQLD